MSRGVNKVTIVGNLGADPEVRYTGGGTAVCEIRVATSEQWTDKQSGEKQERTEWHRIVFWGRLAEIAGEYLKKGKQVYVEGSLYTDKYTDKEGVERYATKIKGAEMQMLGGGGQSQQREEATSPERRPAETHDARREAAVNKARQGAYGNAPAPSPADAFDDDDIPF